MIDRMAHRGPDGRQIWTSGPIGFGHCAFHTLPEEVGHSQPRVSVDGHLRIVMDGRIDNRAELESQLGLKTEVPDAEIVLAAFERWREQCPEHLLGDFAFAIWDDTNRQLFCARDCLGQRPFYYFLNDQILIAASEKAAIFTNPVVRRTPNEPVVAAMLMLRTISQTETLHRDILRLAPATSMTVAADRVSTQRYWRIEDIPPQPPMSEEEYAERLWDLLVEATRCRMRSLGSVSIQLSGGVDSTAVATAMSHLQQALPGTGGPLRSYSLVFPGWSDADESHFIRNTAAELNLHARMIPTAVRAEGSYEDDVQRYLDLPDYFNDVFMNPLRHESKRDGSSVMLSGIGGDEWFTGSDYQQLDALRNLRLLNVWRQSRINSAARRQSLWTYLWRHIVKPLCPAPLVRFRQRLRSIKGGVPDWIDPEFARRTDLLARLVPVRIASRKVAAHHQSLAMYESGFQVHLLEAHERLNARHGLEIRQPLNDRRLIEFALGIPDELRKFNGTTKIVLRNACGERMPDLVRKRSGKAEYSRQLAAEMGSSIPSDFFCSMKLAERGWVIAPRVQEMRKELLAQATQPGYRAHSGIWHVYGLELMARFQAL